MALLYRMEKHIALWCLFHEQVIITRFKQMKWTKNTRLRNVKQHGIYLAQGEQKHE